MEELDKHDFGISKPSLDKIFFYKTEKYQKFLNDLKGVQGLANLMRTDLKQGLTDLDKTSVFFRRKTFDNENSSKLTINHNHLYSSIFQAGLYFCLSLLKFFRINNNEKFENMILDFIESIAFFMFSIIFLILAFSKINKYHMKNLHSFQEDYLYNVLRKGEVSKISYKDLLIGDVLIVNAKENLGLISGIIVEGHLEIVTKDSTIPKKIEANDRIFPETSVISGKGLLLLCRLGKKSLEEKKLTLGMDKLSKLIYVLLENSGVFGRLFAWLTIMLWIFHCHFRGKLEMLDFLDGLGIMIVICTLMNPTILLWIMNTLKENYQKKLTKELGISVKNMSNLIDISYIVLDTNKLFEESLKVHYISDAHKIYDEKDFVRENQNSCYFKKNMTDSLWSLIERDINLMTKTEKSLMQFLDFVSSEKYFDNKEKKIIKSPKNYKMVEDSQGGISKLGQYEDIIGECDFQININDLSPLDKFHQEQIYQEMQSKEVDKILSVSKTIEGKTTFLGFIGFDIIYHSKEILSHSFEKLENFGIKFILLSEKTEEDCKKMLNSTEMAIKEIKNNDEILNDTVSDFQFSTLICEANEETIVKILQMLKEQEKSAVLSINEGDSDFPNDSQGNITVLTGFALDPEKFINSNVEINLQNKPINALTKALFLSENLCLHLKNCLFSKIIISVTLLIKAFFSTCVQLQPPLHIFYLILISILCDLYLVIWVYVSDDFSESYIAKNKKKMNSELLINSEEIKKIIFAVAVSFITFVFMNLGLNDIDTGVVVGFIVIWIFNANLGKKQFLSIAFTIVLAAFFRSLLD